MRLDPCRVFAGNASRGLAAAICERLKSPLGDCDVSRFEDGEVSVRFNENIRGGDVFIVQATGAPGGQPHGAAGHARRGQARLGAAGDRGAAVLRLRAPGPQGPAARADLGQAGGEPDHRGGRGPRAHHGSAQRADPGLLRHPVRSPLRRAGAGGSLPAQADQRSDGGRAGHRQREDGARLRQASRRGAGAGGQAPPAPGLGRGHEPDRRGRGPATWCCSTTSSPPRARSARPRK